MLQYKCSYTNTFARSRNPEFCCQRASKNSKSISHLLIADILSNKLLGHLYFNSFMVYILPPPFRHQSDFIRKEIENIFDTHIMYVANVYLISKDGVSCYWYDVTFMYMTTEAGKLSGNMILILS